MVTLCHIAHPQICYDHTKFILNFVTSILPLGPSGCEEWREHRAIPAQRSRQEHNSRKKRERSSQAPLISSYERLIASLVTCTASACLHIAPSGASVWCLCHQSASSAADPAHPLIARGTTHIQIECGFCFICVYLSIDYYILCLYTD